MSPITHLLAGWTVANALPLDRRDRMLVTIAGVIPDVDGLGIIAEVLTRQTAHPLMWWTEYHHVFGHNLVYGLLCAALAACWSRQRGLVGCCSPSPIGWERAGVRVLLLILISFHLHLVGDILGGRGPDGYIWTVPYFWPLSDTWILAWKGQWKLNSWQNLVITAGLIGWTLRLAAVRGCSPVELFSRKADAAVVETVKRWFRRG